MLHCCHISIANFDLVIGVSARAAGTFNARGTDENSDAGVSDLNQRALQVSAEVVYGVNNHPLVQIGQKQKTHAYISRYKQFIYIYIYVA